MREIVLGDVLDVKRGTTLSGEYYASEGSLVRLTLGNFNYPCGGFKENTAKNDIYFTGHVNREFILNKGDIITPLTEQVVGLLGETATIPESNLYIQSGDIGLIIPDETQIDRRFAYYLISSPIIKNQISSAAQQTKIRHTSPDVIKACKAWIPEELSVQKEIGIVLDSINDKIALNSSICSDLNSMSKMIYDYWFIQFDFPDKNGNPYKSSKGKMKWNEELKRNVPEGWKVGKVSDLGNVIGGATPSTSNKEYYVKNGIGWITPNDLSNTKDKYIAHGERDITSEAVDSCSTVLMPKGTVLMSSRAPIGYLAIASDTLCTNQGFKSVVPNGYSSEFIYQTLRVMMPYIKQYGAGSKFAEVSADELANMRVLLPDITIEKKYYQKIKNIEEQILVLEEENRQLISLRNFLLPLLMNGQVKVEKKKS